VRSLGAVPSGRDVRCEVCRVRGVDAMPSPPSSGPTDRGVIRAAVPLACGFALSPGSDPASREQLPACVGLRLDGLVNLSRPSVTRREGIGGGCVPPRTAHLART
jgi:hypothetical protein